MKTGKLEWNNFVLPSPGALLPKSINPFIIIANIVINNNGVNNEPMRSIILLGLRHK